MIVAITADAPESTPLAVLSAATAKGLAARTMPDGRGGTVIGVGGMLAGEVLDLPGVGEVRPVHKPYMLASLEMRQASTVMVGDVPVGAGSVTPVIMAGPCSVEGRESLIETARAVKAAGARILRGGAFKPRTSPYSFQGLGEEGLKHLADAREATGLPVVTEVMEPDQVEVVAAYADMLQIGARNMANFPLLKRAGRADKPVMLKRGFSATVEEWLMSAEYVLASGNPNVVLCERGIRGFDAMFRFNLDLNVVPAVKEVSHLPVIVDPSHGTGKRTLVGRMALAGLAAGADGLMIEVHPDPDRSMCDGAQTITPAELARIHRTGLAVHTAIAEADAEGVDRLVMAAGPVALSA
jgi:3-deoxy-7-phosphoheptulonate synthase